MKKTRYIPFGYTVRNGHMVIEHKEADVIREIFQNYITGASLKTIADDLTERGIPYTEKTSVWDKARIARIIENTKYLGNGEYDPIIDEKTFERAIQCKESRQTNRVNEDSEAISLLRERVRCGNCGAPMVRKISPRRTTRESWVCNDPECQLRVCISDHDLVQKVTLLMNRIIENNELLIPRKKAPHEPSSIIKSLQQSYENELDRDNPSEEFVIASIQAIASKLYDESQSRADILAQMARKRASLMNPIEQFNSTYFTDLVANVILHADGEVSIITKTDAEISEVK